MYMLYKLKVHQNLPKKLSLSLSKNCLNIFGITFKKLNRKLFKEGGFAWVRATVIHKEGFESIRKGFYCFINGVGVVGGVSYD